MRRVVLLVLLVLVLAVSAVAMAGPPEGDPTGGHGENGNQGCRGTDTADGVRDSASEAAFDLVNSILGCDDDEEE